MVSAERSLVIPPTARPSRRPLTRPAATALALVIGILLSAATPALAASYRYWGFYELNAGAWAFASKGPDQITPADGAVEGWRFAVADENGRMPRAVLTFDQVCATTRAVAGKKRVAVVVDYGRPADVDAGTPPAPKSGCAVLDPAATATQALAAVATPRVEKGLVCALDGWPATGCGDAVGAPSDAAKAADTPIVIAAPTPTPTASATAATSTTTADSGSYTPVWLSVLAILAVVGALIVAGRRMQARNRV